MKFTLSFDTENTAFDGITNLEIARILRDLANHVENDDIAEQYKNVRDINGNVVGTYRLK